MSKNKKIALVAAAALLFSVLAGFLVFQFLTPRRTMVYVFNANYSAGTPVVNSMFMPLQVDSDLIAAGRSAPVSEQFVTSAEYAAVLQSGDSLRMDVGKGMPLTISLLSVTGGSSIEQNMAPSSVAITIPLNNITGVTSELQPGSRVNIYVSSDASGQATTLQFQNMRILSVFRNESGGIASASVEATTVDQALKLVNAATYDNIYLGLIDVNGYQTVPGAPSYSPYA